MLQRTNVLQAERPLTQTSMRDAISGIIRTIQLDTRESDQDMADRLGVSSGTIANARNGRGDLNAFTILKVGAVYGVHRLDPWMHLAGGRGVPTEAVCTTDQELPIAVAEGQLFLAKAMADDRISDDEVIQGAEAIDKCGKAMDALRWRLSGLRSRGMVG